MKQVILKPLLHRNDERIGIYFKHNSSLNNVIKKLPEIKWSQSNRCWHLPLKEEVYKQIQSALNEYAEIDRSALKLYLEKRKTVLATVVTSSEKKIISKPISSSIAWKLSHENIAALEKFIEQLKLKSYSPSTIRTYRNEFLQLLQLLKTKPVNELMPDDLRRYMVYAMEKEGIKDIDSGRMQIFIQKAKGKKDRYVNLSPILLDILRSYFKYYKPKPTFYLFESEYSREAYSVRTAQQIFSNAKKKAGISKDVGIHSLRNSFATHLL